MTLPAAAPQPAPTPTPSRTDGTRVIAIIALVVAVLALVAPVGMLTLPFLFLGGVATGPDLDIDGGDGFGTSGEWGTSVDNHVVVRSGGVTGPDLADAVVQNGPFAPGDVTCDDVPRVAEGVSSLCRTEGDPPTYVVVEFTDASGDFRTSWFSPGDGLPGR